MFGLSAISCFLVCIGIFVFAYWVMPREYIWIPFLLLTILFAVLAYHAVPNETDDLSRYYQQLDYLREYGKPYLDRCFAEGIYDWDKYRVCGYYFYFVSKLPSNAYLQAITIFLVYGLAFRTLWRVANRFSVTKSYLFVAAFFFICTYWYYDTMSGIRNGLAYAIIVACAYTHLLERKHILFCCIGYILAFFLHPASVILMGIVLLTVLTFNTDGRALKCLVFFGVVIGAVLISYLSQILDNEFMQSLVEKSDAYTAFSLNTNTKFMVNISAFVFVMASVAYYNFYLQDSERATELRRILKFNSMILYFMLGCILNSLIFLRFARWILPEIGAFYLMVGQQMQSDRYANKNTQHLLSDGTSYKEKWRVKTIMLFPVLYVVYSCAHLAYACVGSSLIWMHF